MRVMVGFFDKLPSFSAWIAVNINQFLKDEFFGPAFFDIKCIHPYFVSLPVLSEAEAGQKSK